MNGKVPQHTPFHFMLVSSKDLGFRRIILKCDHEPSTKALQDAVIHASVGVEVIPRGPPEGDHMANGRVEMAERQVKRQCRTLRISLKRIQVYVSQMTVHYSVGFLVSQRKS